ncbi:hypothetical protein O0L34_g12513 [Tuta absoluta]|nr:hypothetical protein O0L34_g12513 [Tuta absoluta]
MSGSASPVNGGFEGGADPTVSVRLKVRKDLFPDVRLPQLAPDDCDSLDELDELDSEAISCVNLETDFEQRIDEIASQKLQVANGLLPSPTKSRHRKHKQRSRRDSDWSAANGYLKPEKRRKKSPRVSRHRNRTPPPDRMLRVKGGKNLNLVSSSEHQESDEEEAEEEIADSESSEDEVLKKSVKLPIIVPRQSGKPYSHELSQLSTKKKKSKNSSKEKRTHAVTPCSGKPRSMLGICSSHSKKKSKKSELSDSGPTYHSQILDTTNLKIKIRRTGAPDVIQITPITPTSISDIGQRKSKKKRAASPVASESSGEEYDPSRGDKAAISVAAPKPRNVRPKTPKVPKAPKASKSNVTKNKDKSEKTERSRVSAADSKEIGPQSPWADRMPEEILFKIFENVVTLQGTLPSVIRLGRVCRLWHNVSCRPELWKNVDLAQYTSEKCKTDYKLVWLLENRLTKCQSLNIAQWKVCNVSWVLACVAEYCPGLVELSLAGWSRITAEQLFELLQGLPALQRLDLSLTSETGGSSTCLSAAPMARLCENFGSRLTHLTLANNKFTALPQILSSVAAHCVNLEVLDISGAQATSHPAAVPLEALQKGCPKMRVFRAANAQLVLANASTSQQMESSGWTQLEELSIAGEAAAERERVGEYRLGDEALARLVRGATRLRLLDLRGLQRLTDSGLVRVPAWDLQHLFLGGCNVTRQSNACLELICEKWSHSLIEIDLSWASANRVLDAAVCALAESTNSKLKVLNLCGSSVSLEPIKKILKKCLCIESLNLSSCRALPRGMKRLYTGKELQHLKDSFDPNKPKAKEEDEKPKKKGPKKKEADSKTEDTKESPKGDESDTSGAKAENSQDQSSSSVFQEPKSVPESETSLPKTPNENIIKSPSSAASKTETMTPPQDGRRSARDATPKLLSPLPHSKPDSSSTPRSDPKADFGSPHFSPLPKPDSQVQNSPNQPESVKSNSSWNLGQFKTTPTYKSEASPLNRMESHSKLKHGKAIEQCSPTTSLENKPSPETLGVKQDIKNPNYYNSYSPMPRQDTPFSSQRSPYSAQPSPAQPSPYSTQPSPYSTQPSPYSSQPSPYSAQPSPDTSQIVKPDLQKSGGWNSGSYSPMPKHPQFSPHPSTHASPDPGLGVKSDLRSSSGKTGGYSPMSRQDRIHQSPYSPRPSVDAAPYNKKSPANVGNYSPMMPSHLPSPDASQASRTMSGRSQDAFARQPKAPDASIPMHSLPQPDPTAWGLDRYGQLNSAAVASLESLVWGAAQSFGGVANDGGASQPQQQWGALPSFESSVRRRADDVPNPWTLPGDYHVNRAQPSDSFVEQNVSFNTLSGHVSHAALQSFLEESFSESSRVD